jgi:hypothetical protein
MADWPLGVVPDDLRKLKRNMVLEQQMHLDYIEKKIFDEQ